MPFPHPKSRSDKHREEDISDRGGVIWNLFERTINVADYRDAKDQVNTANDHAFFGGSIHGGTHLSAGLPWGRFSFVRGDLPLFHGCCRFLHVGPNPLLLRFLQYLFQFLREWTIELREIERFFFRTNQKGAR